jgi:hypothetical protein
MNQIEAEISEEFFGLTESESHNLFYELVNRTPVEEAIEIEKVVDRYGFEYGSKECLRVSKTIAKLVTV